MAVFKFRAVYDGELDCIRDIEIKSNQTFLDLHNVLLSAINFKPGELASFYEADDGWRKGREISLEDMSDEDNPNSEDEKPLIMAQCKLQDFIEDPHAKFIWVYDFLKMWTFALELIKISPKEEAVVIYPRVVKVDGDSPRQFTNKKSATVADEDEDEAPRRKKSSIADLGGIETYDNGEEYGDDDESKDNNGEDNGEDNFDEFSDSNFNDDY
ncbi:MAG: hypothetical protein IT239_03610 [Bacteroidia bacterium]|nr:hypothetical protein [Bacteroidia bacterium]